MTTEGSGQYDQNRGQGGYGGSGDGPGGGYGGSGQGVSGSSYGQTGYGRESGGYTQDYSQRGQGGGYGEPQGGPGYGAAPLKPRNGLGIAALIVGILAVLTFWVPILGAVLGILAIIFGAIGRGRVKKREATNGGVALTGLILGILVTLVNIAIIVLAFVFGIGFLNSGAGQCVQQQLQSGADGTTAAQTCSQQIQSQYGG